MKLIGSLAFAAFLTLPLEKQHELFKQYIEFVEKHIEEEEPVSLYFLEWFMTQEGSVSTEEQHATDME